ncbi:hypothetical protein Pmar_PMAR019666, partial [Perkinsus marinus ATCC 50983]
EARENAPLRSASSILHDVNGTLAEALKAISPSIYREVVEEAQLGPSSSASADDDLWIRAAVISDSFRLGYGT